MTWQGTFRRPLRTKFRNIRQNDKDNDRDENTPPGVVSCPAPFHACGKKGLDKHVHGPCCRRMYDVTYFWCVRIRNVNINIPSSKKGCCVQTHMCTVICILFMPAQWCDLIHASDWRTLYVARATKAWPLLSACVTGSWARDYSRSSIFRLQFWRRQPY